MEKMIFKKSGPQGAWLLTFSDLITLMLVFFVMLFSMSQLVEEKWEKVYSIMQSSFQYERKDSIITPNAQLNISSLNEVAAKDIDYLYKILIEQFQKSNLMLYEYIERFDNRLVISLPNDALFENNSDVMTKGGINILSVLGGALAHITNQVELIGHADPRPIRSGPYPSNWHLSLARALAIEQNFVRMGYRKPMIVQGVSDAEFHLFNKDISLANRHKMARKVDVVIHASRTRN